MSNIKMLNGKFNYSQHNTIKNPFHSQRTTANSFSPNADRLIAQTDLSLVHSNDKLDKMQLNTPKVQR